MNQKTTLLMRSLLILCAVFLSHCASIEKRTARESQPDVSSSTPQNETITPKMTTPSPIEVEPEIKTQGASTFRRDSKIRLAIILGPGAAKTYAHIGFLRELQKRKIEPEFVGGLEWGALPAALVSWKGYANDAEWQMLKMNESDWFSRGILSGEQGTAGLEAVSEDLGKIFGSTQAQSFRLKFVCPAWNLDRQQTYLMNKGQVSKMLPFCLGYPPLFKPYQRNVASLHDLRALTDYLKSQGANYILFVNVLDGIPVLPFPQDTSASVSWNEHAGLIQRRSSGVDEVMNINMKDYDFRAFDKKKEIVSEGQKRVERELDKWARKLGY